MINDGKDWLIGYLIGVLEGTELAIRTPLNFDQRVALGNQLNSALNTAAKAMTKEG